jgi:hypothetical protein
MELLRRWFSTPGRQAAGWSALGILGLALAAGGILLFGRGGDSPAQASVESPTATASATPAPSATPTPTLTATPTATPSPTPSATANPEVRQPAGGSNAGAESTAVAEATAAPTAEPVVAGGPYCPPGDQNYPPNGRVAGALSLHGGAAPIGTLVTVAFDGVAGPSRATDESDAKQGGYHVDFYIAAESCANRAGATISVIVDGQVFSTNGRVGGAQLTVAPIVVP